MSGGRALWAEPLPGDWVGLVRACEVVIAQQTFAPLEDREPALFSAGLPGVTEYAVYDRSRTVVAIATREADIWQRCLVREPVESRARWQDIATVWDHAFTTGFPAAEYRWVKWPFYPVRPLAGAVRCLAEEPAIVIMPDIGHEFLFRVTVDRDTEARMSDICAARPGG